MQNTVTVKDRQTPPDLAIQTSGSVEAVFDFARKNGKSITSDLTPGEALATVAIVTPENVDYYVVNELSPASSDTVRRRNRGINYDRIEGPAPACIVYPNS